MALITASLNINCFSTIKNGDEIFKDKFNILVELNRLKKEFIYLLADVGPYESFKNYEILCSLVRELNKINFTPRLLTSGRYFLENQRTIHQFRDLEKLGVAKTVLRLDKRTAIEIPDQNIVNYVDASGAIGQPPFIRFDIEDNMHERFYEILRLVENYRFYNDIYLKKRSVYVRKKEDKLPNNADSYYRLIIDGNGDVLLRTLNDSLIEFEVGNLNERSLSEMFELHQHSCLQEVY